ncbi:5'-nucleotidase [Arenibacter sp. GZD96]|uniref:5'-nucleotidase n=1 Tax=Aurantibrevibacter litoralis TaxID=3106030 RepID=UPI002AFFB549|nr:5'-nucleotidase [Arenibacter sp. GZD-96]MEA1786342.1 5'-nucleotidase [Arenibacter sp. GZD-96]
MILKIKHFVIITTIFTLISCTYERVGLHKVVVNSQTITDSIQHQVAIEAFILPYRQRVTTILDSALAYAPEVLSKEDGRYNSTEGNLLADLVLQMAQPVFKARTGYDIDFVLLNYGGIRSTISKGNVSARTAYEVMPFENDIVIVQLNATAVRDIVSFLIKADVPHPIAGIQIQLNDRNEPETVKIKGNLLNEAETYFVATSNYLAAGGDNMTFFSKGINQWELNYYIRNAMIDYFGKVDTLKSKIDDRFVKHNK